MKSLALLVFLAWPSLAWAQTTGIAVDRLVPAVGPAGLISVESAQVTGFGQAAWAGSFGVVDRPLTLRGQFSGAAVARPVERQLSTDVSVEAGLWKRIAFAVGAPFVLWQDGDRLRGTGVDERPLGRAAAGDLRLRAKAAFLGDPARAGLHAALALLVTVPMGGEADFAATDGVTVEPRLFVDLRYPRFAIAANLGVRFAPERKLFLTSFGDELTWAVGGLVFVGARGPWRGDLIVEAAGAVGASPGTRPVELRGAARLGYGPVTVDVGAGGGLVDEATAPAWRFFVIARGVVGRAR